MNYLLWLIVIINSLFHVYWWKTTMTTVEFMKISNSSIDTINKILQQLVSGLL